MGDWLEHYSDKFVPEDGTHILFNHILELFRSGLIQVFFLLACIWIYIFAVAAMYVLGTQECIDKAIVYHDLPDIPWYERFDTLTHSIISMFRVATGSGWHEVMFLYWECESPWGGYNFTPTFFVFFHFTFCIVFYNVLGGLIFAHYKSMADKTEAINVKKEERKKEWKKKEKQKKKRKKKNRKYLAKGRGSAIPEMRKSARFWREALDNTQGGGGEPGNGKADGRR